MAGLQRIAVGHHGDLAAAAERVAESTNRREIEVPVLVCRVDLDALDVEEIDPGAVGEVVLVPTLRKVRVAQGLERRAVQRRPKISVGIGDLADVDDRDARDTLSRAVRVAVRPVLARRPARRGRPARFGRVQ